MSFEILSVLVKTLQEDIINRLGFAYSKNSSLDFLFTMIGKHSNLDIPTVTFYFGSNLLFQ